MRKNCGAHGALVLLGCCLAALMLPLQSSSAAKPRADAKGSLNVVVMDPLAAPLSCPCVKGYAQRDYDKLAAYLQKSLKMPVQVVYAESLKKATDKLDGAPVGLVIGKQSVVEYDLKSQKLSGRHLAALTGKDGSTTQTGLIVVPSKAPAKSAADLKQYRIIFGPVECAEKHAAALAVLKAAGVPAPSKLETSDSCSDGATLILELPEGEYGAAVISSYAKPLLEGCGTVKKGDLRVVAETAEVPFIAAFSTENLPVALNEKLTAALLAVGGDADLCLALETQQGFVPPETSAESAESGDLTKKK